MRALLVALSLALPLRPQVVEESFAREPGALDFIRGEGLEQAILQSLAGDSLVGVDPGGRVVPRLADRWEPRPGGLRFHLRGEARFADGTPVTTQDVLWTFSELRTRPEASPTRKALLDGVEASAEGGNLLVRSQKPAGRLLLDLARIFIAKQGRPELGSGPFALSRQGSDWRFTARPHFLQPRIAGLHFRLVGDGSAVHQNLLKGWLSIGVPPARPGLQPPPSHRELHQPTHAQIVVWSRLGPGALKALERWRGEAFPPGAFGVNAQASRGLWPETLGFPVRAVADQPPPPRGATWELLYAAGDDLAQKAFLALRTRAAKDGVTLDLRPVESALLFDRLAKGTYQLAASLVLFDPHPWAVLEYLEAQGPMNFTGWAHPRLSALLPALTAPDSPGWGELQTLWAAAPGALPVLDLTSVVWVDKRLQVAPSPLGLYLTTPGAAGWTWHP